MSLSKQFETYRENMRKENQKKTPAVPGDKYSFKMPSYNAPEEVVALGQVQVLCQKEAREQLLNSHIKFR